jgi:hypothetical protein
VDSPPPTLTPTVAEKVKNATSRLTKEIKSLDAEDRRSGELEQRGWAEGGEKDAAQRRRYRAVLTPGLGYAVAGWMVFVVAVLLLQGFGSRTGFHLSDKVLITLLTTTTINVLGIFYVVVRYFFSESYRHRRLKSGKSLRRSPNVMKER